MNIDLTRTDSPAFSLSLSGRDISANITPRLISLSLTDARGFEADQLDIELDDADGKLDLPTRGAKIKLALGWKGGLMVDKGDYTVDEIEHSGAPDKITLRARSADLRAGIAQRKERSFHGKTLGEIIRTLAEANGLTAVIPPELSDRKVPHLDQQGESDIALATRLAGEWDAIATVKAGRLLFIRAGDATTASGLPMPPVAILRRDGDSHRFSIADRDNYTAVRAYWQDIDNGKRGEVLVDKNTQFERKNQVGKRGKVLKTKKLTVTQREAIEASADNIKQLRHTYASENTAWQGARSAWEKLQRGVASFEITLARGRPEIMPELPATVQGFKPAIDACSWIIASVTHTLDDNGLITRLALEMKLEDMAS
ncbi:phage late control D family protein [Craterilacuibacter sp. RT1T]|uniref:phage late control D family protein n=1 Tax=Craterilacuibacter sp. RT1T TaxID=2942211 RepID=UPI0020C07631|nr:phage late control D family protein [Craterilacuibacter sp. RT1T]MCL6262161.1 phage late control D family protein [Craterilacuibacter sp. RT1T]